MLRSISCGAGQGRTNCVVLGELRQQQEHLIAQSARCLNCRQHLLQRPEQLPLVHVKVR